MSQEEDEQSFISYLIWYIGYIVLCAVLSATARIMQKKSLPKSSDIRNFSISIGVDVLLIELVRWTYYWSFALLRKAGNSIPYAVAHVIFSILPSIFKCLWSHLFFVLCIGILQLVLLRLCGDKFTAADECKPSLKTYLKDSSKSQKLIESRLSSHTSKLMSYAPSQKKTSQSNRVADLISYGLFLLQYVLEMSTLSAIVVMIIGETAYSFVMKKDESKKDPLKVGKDIGKTVLVGFVVLMRLHYRVISTELSRGKSLIRMIKAKSRDLVDGAANSSGSSGQKEISEDDLLPNQPDSDNEPVKMSDENLLKLD